ncbi:MAG: DMT family transporter [Alphaproteobacteria bacterium]|nr:DMT family transporter [Alphaproteobacteria bacterium]
MAPVRALLASPHLAVTISMMCFAGSFAVVKLVHTTVPPVWLNFWRTAVALVVLLVVIGPALRTIWPDIRRHWRFFLVAGFLLITAGNATLFVALHHTTVVNAGVINSLVPVVIVVVSWVFYADRLSLRQAVGVTLSLGGVLCLIARADIDVLLGFAFNRGDIGMMVAVLSWALYAVMIKRGPPLSGATMQLVLVTVGGLVTMAPWYAWEAATVPAPPLDTTTLAAVAYLGLVTSAFASVLWTRAVQVLGPNRAAPYTHLMPVFAIAIGILVLGEAFHLYHLGGLALIVVGIVLASVAPVRRAAVSPPGGAGDR